MSLTTSQAAVLSASITSNANVSSALAKHDWFTIANVYNSPTTTIVWRSDITPSQLEQAIVGSEAIAQSAQQLQLAQIILTEISIDATNPNVRAQFASIFPGSSAASTIANLTAVAQRSATKYESLFVSSSQVSSVYGYTLTPLDVQSAMGG